MNIIPSAYHPSKLSTLHPQLHKECLVAGLKKRIQQKIAHLHLPVSRKVLVVISYTYSIRKCSVHNNVFWKTSNKNSSEMQCFNRAHISIITWSPIAACIKLKRTSYVDLVSLVFGLYRTPAKSDDSSDRRLLLVLLLVKSSFSIIFWRLQEKKLISTLYSLTSVCTFSSLFSKHFLRFWQGEFV